MCVGSAAHKDWCPMSPLSQGLTSVFSWHQYFHIPWVPRSGSKWTKVNNQKKKSNSKSSRRSESFLWEFLIARAMRKAYWALRVAVKSSRMISTFPGVTPVCESIYMAFTSHTWPQDHDLSSRHKRGCHLGDDLIICFQLLQKKKPTKTSYFEDTRSSWASGTILDG